MCPVCGVNIWKVVLCYGEWFCQGYDSTCHGHLTHDSHDMKDLRHRSTSYFTERCRLTSDSLDVGQIPTPLWHPDSFMS